MLYIATYTYLPTYQSAVCFIVGDRSYRIVHFHTHTYEHEELTLPRTALCKYEFIVIHPHAILCIYAR